MTATCPAGHESETTDYCDVCGLRMASGDAAPPVVGPVASQPEPEPDSGVLVRDEPPPERPCPNCGEPNALDSRFCEGCGFDLTTDPPVAHHEPGESGPAGSNDDGATIWEAVVLVDRDLYDQAETDGIAFPETMPERRLRLSSERARIGRRRHSSPDLPEIDLSGPPEDTGVSHEHAELLRGADGWSLIDCGSTNGTFLNDLSEPIAPDRPVELHDGDRIHLGAWTTIVIARGQVQA